MLWLRVQYANNDIYALSGVGIATDYRLDGAGFRFPAGERLSSTPITSRTAVRSPQPPSQWIPRALSPGKRGQGLETGHSPPFSAKVNNCGAIPPLPYTSIWHRDNFTLPLPSSLSLVRVIWVSSLFISLCVYMRSSALPFLFVCRSSVLHKDSVLRALALDRNNRQAHAHTHTLIYSIAYIMTGRLSARYLWLSYATSVRPGVIWRLRRSLLTHVRKWFQTHLSSTGDRWKSVME
jgi:hypothetical protein